MVTTNLLKALIFFAKSDSMSLTGHNQSTNRINNQGESLELFIKNAFCNSFHCDEKRRMELFESSFSYFGNQNNPPDFIIKNGDAVEVKKIQSKDVALALNSSTPKRKLVSSSSMITDKCRICEEWTEKDLIYAVGHVSDNMIKSIWFVYGDCYAASCPIYERIKNKISEGLHEIHDIELSPTKELGRVNKVDPLGITNLRVRGMWHIEHPQKVFQYLVTEHAQSCYEIHSVMLETKYQSFPEYDRHELEDLALKGGCLLEKVKIKSPDNPVNLLEARYFSMVRR